jgi:hypothetical protein
MVTNKKILGKINKIKVFCNLKQSIAGNLHATKGLEVHVKCFWQLSNYHSTPPPKYFAKCPPLAIFIH